MNPNTPTKNASEEKSNNPTQSAKEMIDRGKETATSMGDRAKETATHLTDRAKEAASNLGDRAKEAASMARDRAEHAASYVGDQAEGATAAVGGRLKSLGHTIRERTPDSGMLGSASSAVADSFESAGRYLEDEGLRGMADDITSLIRRNPIPALLVGIGIGFLVARATTSRR